MNLLKKFWIVITKRDLKKIFYIIYFYIKSNLLRFLKKKIIIKNIYNFKMILGLNDLGISKTLILFGERELEHKFIIDKILKKNMTVLDIGSNIGYYPLIELEIIGKDGLLIAVEPSPDNFKLLKENLALNNYNQKNITTYNVAISSKSETKKFYISKYSNLNSFHLEESNKYLTKDNFIQVGTKTIEEITKKKKIDFIRMDVEGHEVSILRSIMQYVKNTSYKPSILFEPHLKRYNAQNDIKKPLEELFDLGYTVSILGSTSEKGSEIINALGYNSNLLFKTDEEIRKIYYNIKNQDSIKILTKLGGARSVLLT